MTTDAMQIKLADGAGTIDLKYLVEDVDRHGRVRIYFRRKGQRKICLKQPPGTTAFLEEYRAAAGTHEAVEAETPRASLKAIAQEYYQSSAFKRLGPQVRKRRRTIIDGLCAEKDQQGKEKGLRPLGAMHRRHIHKMRDALADVPGSANDLLKALRGLFRWAVDVGRAEHDPAAEVRYLSTATDGFHTWSIEEVRQFEARHPIGSKARLALALLLFTGARRSDAVRLGPQMVRDGWLNFTETKGQARKVKVRQIPILPELKVVLDASKSGHLAYLVTAFNKPFTSNGFGNWFRKRCDEAGLPHCSAHGLRKAGATIAAENGATEHQLMAIYGWDSPKQAALYTRKANRKRLAGDAMRLVVPANERIDDADSEKAS